MRGFISFDIGGAKKNCGETETLNKGKSYWKGYRKKLHDISYKQR